ncbi:MULTISPECIES: hypothetical protein [unclassified Streptomyces]|uniref:hypothetical protein n=1 Tax=unclassified Streptomyces TaxID=2593676 RepID=UPI00190709E5|nr:hypothetical protein [Streptomyces sp. HSG2]
MTGRYPCAELWTVKPRRRAVACASAHARPTGLDHRDLDPGRIDENQALGSGRHLPVAVTHPEPDADPALVHEPTGSGRRGDLDGDLARHLDHFDPGHRGPLRGLDLGTAGPYS